MLDLLPLAYQAAKNCPDRQDLLMAVADDDVHALTRALENNDAHDQLLADDFFMPFMGICVAMGSASIWKALKSWGYWFDTPIKHPEDTESAQMTVGEWAACILDPQRLQELIDDELLDAFSPGSQGIRLTPADRGMLVDRDLFDFWVVAWEKHVEALIEKRRECGQGMATPTLPKSMDILVGMAHIQRDGKAYHPSWPKPDDAADRLERFMEAFGRAHYGSDRQAQWEGLLELPPAHGKIETVIGLFKHFSSKAPEPFHEGMLERFLGRSKANFMVVQGLLSAGAPLSTSHPNGLAWQLLQTIQEGSNEGNGAWQGWLNRARAETPWMIEALDGVLGEDGRDYARLCKQDKAATNRTLEALILAHHAGPAAARPKVRL